MSKELEITFVATVDDDFSLWQFWDDIGGNGTSQFMRVYNASFRDMDEVRAEIKERHVSQNTTDKATGEE